MGDSSRSVGRAADNELYDHGCDLVAAATAIRQIGASPDAARAVPAVFGCIEAAARELAEAVSALEHTMADVAPVDARDPKSARMRRGSENLRHALEDAARAAAAARPLAARMLARVFTGRSVGLGR
jgi:hypothetical protein